MDQNRSCKSCGTPLPAAAPEGLCPRCLLNVGLGSEVETKPANGVAPRGRETSFTPPDPAQLERELPQIQILELMGQGGMGAVYKARQRGLDRIVALKLLPTTVADQPGFADRFAREARALARLNHPNIVTIYDFGQAGSFFYFVMEFVDGVNLRQTLRTQKLTAREALALVPQICAALQYAHDEGVVHRDIKPENILLDKKGRIKIADFGLAKLLGIAAETDRLTQAEQVMGTPHYMAPEQIEHPLTVDHRADIYSLGVVFYEMLTGELPLGRFAPPSHKVQIDVRLDEVVLRTLEKEPGRRYQQVSEFKTQVENIAGMGAEIPAHWRQWAGFEWRSKTTLWGLPLVHITSGVDPATGRNRVACGIIAVGDVAKGVVAFGGLALGGIAFGGVGVGVISFSGLAVGALSIGGLALGLVMSYGGLAIAPIALGGAAFGYYACGGGAWGIHAVGGNASDPAARAFFRGWAGPWMTYSLIPLMLISLGVSFLAPRAAKRRLRASAA